MSLHAANLSRGLLCPHLGIRKPDLYVRIQSTACEQKRWAQVALSLGPHVLTLLATGSIVIVHDFSEKPRTTRALWQGLPWLRFALARAWSLEPESVISRSGLDVTDYAERCWRALPRTTRKELSYFKRFKPHTIWLYGCQERAE